MKAITVHQPWAALIAAGVKTVETRSWRTDYRGPLAIHAGMKNACEGVGRDLPHGKIVAICTLRDVVPTREATVGDADRALGDYSDGRYAWLLDDIVPVDPVRCRGLQGVWDVPAAIERRLNH